MNREELVDQRNQDWQRLEALVKKAERIRAMRAMAPTDISRLAELYRGMAGDLMRVRRDRLGADLERYLDNLANRAHNTLYAGTSVGGRFTLTGLLLDFPGAVRRNHRWFWVATALFYIPMFLAGYAAYLEESYALAILPPEQLEAVQQMYAQDVSQGRSIDQNELMTGYYVRNNIGIAFRCFATGILFGLGPIFYLMHNGLFMGVVEGHLARVGLWHNLMAFTATHSPWELTAIVLSGAAGLQMGWSMVITKGRTRIGNLQAHGFELLRQIAGVTVFLTIAALIEAWYSPSTLPYSVKYASGAVGWLLVVFLLWRYGRRRALPDDVKRLRGES
ncbi:MAG: stage II sporulation protein M [Myxococcota bacterium]